VNQPSAARRAAGRLARVADSRRGEKTVYQAAGVLSAGGLAEQGMKYSGAMVEGPRPGSGGMAL